MPPVTTRPLNGSRLQIRWMCSGMRVISVVTVADSQLVSAMCAPKRRGARTTGPWPAIRRHRSQAGAGPSSSAAGVCWSPRLSSRRATRSSPRRGRSRATAAHAAGSPSSDPVDAGRLLAPGVMSKSMSVTSVPNRKVTPWSRASVQREHERLVLVVPRELEGREVGHAADVMDEAMEVELHLERAVPLLEGEHRPPVQPEVALQEVLAEDLVDPLALHLLARGEEHLA